MIASLFYDIYQYILNYPLLVLFLSAFISATLVPMGSEAIFVMALSETTLAAWVVITVASLGNTLGGITNYALGRWLSRYKASQRSQRRATEWLRRYGVWALLLSWLPVVGDPICVAAGWLRVPAYFAIAMMFIGKMSRYMVLAAIFYHFV
ncbi:YqaA family protein [Vibrio palustris]|uniref:Inner membrane protein YqaA n=1 Tax=Vibrio palustris TaxID=1918946 RepID=A0A1R4AZL4_9VIBR|nr:YqaA family protein [Vibrio palustris]SJL82098.1 Inner membrane protein YqaA [Vibrio palustris]